MGFLSCASGLPLWISSGSPLVNSLIVLTRGQWNTTPGQDLQEAFYRQNLSTQDAIRVYNETLEGHEQHEQYYEDGGEFLPLKVWELRGYDANMIVENTPENMVKWDPQAGWVYKVRVLKSGNRGCTGKTRRAKCKADSAVPKPEVRLALEDGDVDARLAVRGGGHSSDSGSGSSYSSYSSNSSDSSHHHKKGRSRRHKKSKKDKKDRKHRKSSRKDRHGKKDKKEKKHKRGDDAPPAKRGASEPPESAAQKKCREALERAKAKEQEKLLIGQVKEAKIIEAKVVPVVDMLENLVQAPEWEYIPGMISAPLSAILANLLQTLERCRAVVASGGAGDLDDLKKVLADIGSAKKHAALVQNMMKAVKKHT